MLRIVHRKGARGGGAAAVRNVLVALALAWPSSAFALTTPLHVAADTPIKDEFGQNLQGSSISDPSERDLVQILWASNSIADPPDYDGVPTANNSPVENGMTSMGSLTAPDLSNPGYFGVSIADPRPSSGQLFVRVFNAPTLDEASFYADSEILVINQNQVLIAKISATTNAIDPRDPDGDGLNNSWEKSMKSDNARWDTDGDGVSDGDEFWAKTGILDEQSKFIVANLSAGPGNSAVLTWDSVPGVKYQVQYTTDDLDADPQYTDIGETITASAETTQLVVANGLNDARGHYRVRLAK